LHQVGVLFDLAS